MRHYVTYCDIGYAARALVLAESLHRHETHPYELVVVCFDELTRLVVEELAPGNISTVPLHKSRRTLPELHRCRARSVLGKSIAGPYLLPAFITF